MKLNAILSLMLVATLASSSSAKAIRKRSEASIDETAVEYMGKLDSLLADKQGIPKDLDSAPTNVFCFLDKGIAKV